MDRLVFRLCEREKFGQFHPVGHGNVRILADDTPVLLSLIHIYGVLCALLALDGACLIDGSAVQQQLFGQSGLTEMCIRDRQKGVY